jgi:hypothetical protein
VQRLHEAFEAAERDADIDTLRALLADDFRSIGDQGRVLDKEQWLGKFGDFAYTSLESSEVEVRTYDRAAIVRCVQHSRSTWQEHRMELTTRVSQTWVEQSGGWRLAGLQFSTLASPE